MSAQGWVKADPARSYLVGLLKGGRGAVPSLSTAKGKWVQPALLAQIGHWPRFLLTVQSMRAAPDHPDFALLRDLEAFALSKVVNEPCDKAITHGNVLRATVILAQRLTHFWLDSGSLLGPLRDGGPIAWDSDLDFGAWEDQLPLMETLAEELRAHGIKVTSRIYRGRNFGYTIKLPKMKPLHVHINYRQGDTLWRPQTISYYRKTRPEMAKYFPGHNRTRRAMQLTYAVHKHKKSRHPTARKVLSLIWRVFVRTRSRYPREVWSTRYPFRLLHRTACWVLPAHHFDHLSQLTLNDINVPMPSAPETYLALRYGKNWDVPQSDWIYWLDDGGLKLSTPEELGFGKDAAPHQK
ncbi:LicD family protein [Rhodobacteraceae bacterium KMM 6894]|nr:LicD family protein [Rhodobacteraceae bacterium KMM 6894]